MAGRVRRNLGGHFKARQGTLAWLGQPWIMRVLRKRASLSISGKPWLHCIDVVRIRQSQRPWRMASQVGSKWDYKGQIDGMKKVLDTRADTAALLLQRVMTVVRHWQHSTDVIASLRSQAFFCPR